MVIGLDDSVETIDFAKEHYKRRNNSFLLRDLARFVPPFPCDMVVAFEVLEHLEDPTYFLDALEQLQPAQLYLSVPHVSVDLDMSDWHYRHYTAGDIKSIMTRLGFKDAIIKVMQFTKGKAVFAHGERLPPAAL
jgi:trans-aconitate methyltransferase